MGPKQQLLTIIDKEVSAIGNERAMVVPVLRTGPRIPTADGRWANGRTIWLKKLLRPIGD